jgi:Ala-tRNA(Pro) deacylase
MAIASTLEDYLRSQGIAYEIVPHPRTMTALATAHSAGVAEERIVKGVLLEDEAGYLLAAVPASRHVKLGELHRVLNRRLGLATEAELQDVFKDCELGAIPPVGSPYGLETVIDDEIAAAPEVYFEAGDHRTLVRLDAEAFQRLVAGARHGRFSN